MKRAWRAMYMTGKWIVFSLCGEVISFPFLLQNKIFFWWDVISEEATGIYRMRTGTECIVTIQRKTEAQFQWKLTRPEGWSCPAFYISPDDGSWLMNTAVIIRPETQHFHRFLPVFVISVSSAFPGSSRRDRWRHRSRGNFSDAHLKLFLSLCDRYKINTSPVPLRLSPFFMASAFTICHPFLMMHKSRKIRVAFALIHRPREISACLVEQLRIRLLSAEI